MSEKIKMPQWIVNIIVVLLFGAYWFLFTSVLDRLTTVETKVEAINIPLLQIQTDMASVKTDLIWLKQNYK